MPLAVTQKDVKSLICCLNFAGASTCKLGICLSRGLAQAVIKEVSRDGLDLGKLGEVNINTIWEFSKVVSWSGSKLAIRLRHRKYL